MKLLKTTVILLFFFTLFWTISCVTIYNYDLSISGLDSLPATRSCIMKYIPHSVDSKPGQQQKHIQLIINDLDNYQAEIIDSLRADSIIIDSSFTLNFKILALDPYDELTEIDVEKTYLEDSVQ